MAKTEFQSVEEYIAAQPKESQRVLRRVRTILRGALPEAEESISYQIPTYKLGGRAVIYFAGWKKHYSLYPLGENVTETLAKELAAYEVEKGTVRFPLGERMPTHLIQRIAKLRAEAVAGDEPARARGKVAKKSKAKRTKATTGKTARRAGAKKSKAKRTKATTGKTTRAVPKSRVKVPKRRAKAQSKKS
jgi:uncharacterized protein YdhG (YjbR/CyaY superfamily)